MMDGQITLVSMCGLQLRALSKWVCDLYKKQYMETPETSFDKKLFSVFNLEMNF